MMVFFGRGKHECWICRRKVSDDGIFLKPEDLEEIFTGVFKDFDVKETFKNTVVCEVCAGIVKVLASETIQAKMAISKKAGELKGKLDKLGGMLKRK